MQGKRIHEGSAFVAPQPIKQLIPDGTRSTGMHLIPILSACLSNHLCWVTDPFWAGRGKGKTDRQTDRGTNEGICRQTRRGGRRNVKREASQEQDDTPTTSLKPNALTRGRVFAQGFHPKG